MGKIVGIDLGTTNSVVAVMEGGHPKVTPAADTGRNITPSVVEPVKNLVGDVAKRQVILNPKNSIYSIKRLMGRRIDDSETERTKKMVPYEVVAGKDKMQGEKIINAPTASALAYGLDKKKSEKIAVYDLGGGTFDISILELGDGVFEVKATNGDTHLGGDDFDEKIVDYICDEFKKDNTVDLRADKQALQRVRDAAEKAKIDLSATNEGEINPPYITQKDGQPMHLTMKLTRTKLA